jgi:hypothetical protein
MVDKITEILVELPEDINEAADSILAHLERLGMVPPLDPKSRDAYGNGIHRWELEQENLTIVTTEQDLVIMKKYREEFIQQIGQDTYDCLVKKLEDFLRNEEE